MVDLITNVPVVILNVKGLNTPNKKQKFALDKRKKNDPVICCLQKTHFKFNDIIQFKIKV